MKDVDMKIADGSGSWMVTCLVSGMVWEIFDKSDHDNIIESNLQSVKVETAREHLDRINEDREVGLDEQA
jgi:hypothetical protein